MQILLAGIVGSRAYGLDHADSDTDRLGVYAAPASDFHGLTLPVDQAATHVTHNPDSTYHEARKYVLLALAGNPTIQELLWLPPELYEVQSAAGDELIRLRRAFLSQGRVRAAYLGYASSQLNRLISTGQFQSKMRSRVEKHARHLLRLLDQGYQLYTTGQLPIRVPDPDRYVQFGSDVARDYRVAQRELAAAETRFAGAVSPLPVRANREAVEAWLRTVRRGYPEPQP